jgi:hypothetical protein
MDGQRSKSPKNRTLSDLILQLFLVFAKEEESLIFSLATELRRLVDEMTTSSQKEKLRVQACPSSFSSKFCLQSKGGER